MKVLIDLSPLRQKLIRMHYGRLVSVDFTDIVDTFLLHPTDLEDGYAQDVLMEYVCSKTPDTYLEKTYMDLRDSIECFRFDLEDLIEYHFGDRSELAKFEKTIDNAALFNVLPQRNNDSR